MSRQKQTWILAGVGLFTLAVGTLVYLTDRDPMLVPFFSGVSLYELTPSLFGIQGLSLPTFTHVFSLSLLTAALLDTPRFSPLVVCASWLVIDLTFELVQHPLIVEHLSGAMDAGPAWFSVFEPVRRYAVHGTYDPLDLLSIVVGAGLALALISLLSGSRAGNEA